MDGENENPFEAFRRKEPVSKMLDEAFTAVDMVLGYLTLKMPDHILFGVHEKSILEIFDKLTELKHDLEKIIPPDDWK